MRDHFDDYGDIRVTRYTGTVALAITTILATCAPLASAYADASIEATKRITIPSGNLDTALEALVQQTGIQILYDLKTVAGLQTRGAQGPLTTKEAITKLLEGTSLELRTDPSGAMLITAPASAPESTSSDSSTQPMPSASGQKESLWSRQGEDERTGRSPKRNELEEIIVKGIPEILVRGSKTTNIDIRRTEDDVQPYVVLGAEEIQRSSANNLEDFLKTRLPMNTATGSGAQSSNNQSSINLRGLGSTQTLVLVDGRRMPSIYNSNDFGQPDINAIPLSAVERIEVLPTTASGIYGGGATGGVINIITRKNYSGFDVQATYGDTFEADASNRRIDLSGGFELEGGRTRAWFAASHAESSPLLWGERDFARKGRELQLANDPSAFYSPTSPPQGYTTNVRSANGSNLVLDNGTPLNSPRTFIPVGYGGVTSDQGAALVANAGQYNLDIPADALGENRSLLNDPTLNSAMLNLRRQFGSIVEGFLDFSWLQNKGHSISASVPTSTTLQANAANNPFTTAINVRFPATALAYGEESETESLRGAAGVIVRLPGDWTAGADYVWSRSRYEVVQSSPILGDPDAAGPGISGVLALSNGALDVMRDLNAFPLDYSPYVLPPNNSLFGPLETNLKDVTLRLSGPLFSLPGGDIALSAIAERREEEAQDSFRDSMGITGVTTSTYFPSRSQDVDSYYTELRIPAFSSQNERSFLRDLELQASVRRDEYETRAPSPGSAPVPSRDSDLAPATYSTNEVEATKYTFGVRYSPLRDVTLRASLGTGFLAPAINQIVPGPAGLSPVTVVDPKREGVARSLVIPVNTAGNPDLIPEESESWSAGVILTPRFIPGLRFSVDYTRIEKTNNISFYTVQDVLNLEESLQSRVKRAPLTPADAARGFTAGAITELDLSLANIASAEVGAYDFQIDYTLATEGFGTFNFYSVATQQPHLLRQPLATSNATEIAGLVNFPKWRGNAGVTWDKGPWTVGLNAQHFGSYLVYAAGSIEAVKTSAILSQGSDSIPGQTYLDAVTAYRFGTSGDSSLLSNTELRIGIQNLLDKDPPILATTAPTGGYSTFADPRLRRFSIVIQKSF